MKKTILAILAAFCGFCASVRADDEGEGEGGDGKARNHLQWSMPQSGWEDIDADISLQFAGMDEPLDIPIAMDMTLKEIGNIIERMIKKTQMTESAKNAFMLSKQALANAAFASIQAQKNTVRIDNLCASVEALFSNTYGQYETAGGKVISKIHSSSSIDSIREQLMKSKNSIAAGGPALGGDKDKPIKIVIDQAPYSQKQFEQWVEDDNSLVSLKGYKHLDEAADDEGLGEANIFSWGVESGNYYIPYTAGKTRSIQWMKFRGIDTECLSGGRDNGNTDNKPLHLKYWNNPNQSGCNESIQNLLTNKTNGVASDRQKHALLARRDAGNGHASVHWVRFDEVALEAGGSPAVDDHTIEQSVDYGAAQDSQKKLRLYGFKEAHAHTIPLKEAAGDNDYALSWVGEITADESSLTTNPATRKISIKGWENEAEESKLSDILLAEPSKPKPDQPAEERAVLVRHTEGSYTNLELYAFGNMYKMSWSTNWNEAAKDIAAKEAEKIINWNTNWVRLADNIVSSQSAMKEYVDNALNWSTNWFVSAGELNNSVEELKEYIDGQFDINTNTLAVLDDIEALGLEGVRSPGDFIRYSYSYQTNLFAAIDDIDKREWVQNITNVYNNVVNEITDWSVITNVFITYLDGKGDAGGGGGGGGNAPLELPPTKDPYKEDFVKEEKYFDYLLPVKNGWMISHMTNNLWGVVNPEHALDNESLYTNNNFVAEINGYWQAKTNQLPVKVAAPEGKKDSDGNPLDYEIAWYDFPSTLLSITTNDIDKIEKWFKMQSERSMLFMVSNNTEVVKKLKETPFQAIEAGYMLDHASVWTNDDLRVEVMGFQHAPYGSYPEKVIGSSNDEVKWTPVPKPDSEVMYGGTDPLATYHRSIERTDDFGLFNSTNVWSIYGFEDADENTAPHVHTDEYGNRELTWKPTGAALRVVGTDGTSRIVGGGAARTNTVNFASAPDSNVKVSVGGNNPDEITVTIGVYYLTESNLSGGNSGGSGL